MAGVNVSIGADSKKAERELKSFERKTRGIAKSIAKGFKERVGHKLFDGLAGAARSIPGMLNEAVQSASSLNEEISKSETIFGSSSKQIQEWSKGAADSMGLSEVAALEFSGVIGNMFTAMGMAQGESARMSQAMVQLGSDLGSFNNTSTEDAINAIGAALRGESEPIRRYGVLLDDATLKAEAMAQGLYDGKGALTPQTRSLAAYSVILKQTTTAQGDFKKTSDGLANSQKILKAQLSDASTEIGKALLPAMQQMVDFLGEIDFKEFAADIGELTSAFVTLGQGAASAYDRFKKFVDLKLNQFHGSVPLEPEDLSGDESFQEFSKQYDQKEVDKQNEEFRKRVEDGEDIGKVRGGEKEVPKDDTSDQDKRKKAEAEITNEYRLRVALLNARISGDKSVIDALEKEKAIREAINESERDGLRISRSTAEMIVKKRGQAKEAEEKRKASAGGLREKLSETKGSLDSAMNQSSITAVSSMQRVGGGGGVSGQLDLQRKQTDLQSKMVGLLRDIKESTGKSISDF